MSVGVDSKLIQTCEISLSMICGDADLKVSRWILDMDLWVELLARGSFQIVLVCAESGGLFRYRNIRNHLQKMLSGVYNRLKVRVFQRMMEQKNDQRETLSQDDKQ